MPAVQERELSEHDFIGHVFTKASPILTWRPTKVQRITPAQIGERASDSAVHRFSRAPTRRMVSWPVVSRLSSGARRTPTRALRALVTLVAFSLLCGSALTLCVYVLLGDSSPFGEGAMASRSVHGTPTRTAVAHVADPQTDTLLTASAPVAAATPLPVPAHRTAARGQHAGRPQHGQHAQHGQASPAASHSGRAARAAHAAAGAGATNRRAT